MNKRRRKKAYRKAMDSLFEMYDPLFLRGAETFILSRWRERPFALSALDLFHVAYTRAISL